MPGGSVAPGTITASSNFNTVRSDGRNWDADPWTLGVSNGVIDLRSGVLRPGRTDDRITRSTHVAFDPAADCQQWERFISDVFDHNEGLIQFIHRALGYSLTGITSEQALFLGNGTGSNGKGVLMRGVGRALGDYASVMPFSTLEMNQRASIPNDLAALDGPRFVTSSETNEGSRINESRTKALTGCDPITARFLHGEYFTFVPAAKFWLFVNHLPVVRDDSHGFWRRIRQVPFTRTFENTPGFEEGLHAEVVGILAWLVRGCLLWQADGLQVPDVVTTATNEYRTSSDVLADFLREACDLSPEAEVGASDMYQHYQMWASKAGLSDRERLTATKFGTKLVERFKRTEFTTRQGL